MIKITFLPKTKLGKWSFGLIIAMFLLFFIGRLSYLTNYASLPSGESILRDIAMRPGVALPMLSGFAVGIISFISGLVGIFKKRDHSILVLISTAIGGLLILLLYGEILFPH